MLLKVDFCQIQRTIYILAEKSLSPEKKYL